MKLYAHQQKIIDDDRKKTGLFLGVGSGKTRIALLLARGKTLVICPKTQAQDQNWEREAGAIIKKAPNDLKLTELIVVSKEVFRRDYKDLGDFNTVIVDEAHVMLGVTPNIRQRKRMSIPKASQMYEALEEFLRVTKPSRIYFCTGTIMRSPFTVWAAASLLRPFKTESERMASFYEFRGHFYTPLPIPGREVWSPRYDSRVKDELAGIVRNLGYVGRLEDFFDVPDQTFITKYVALSSEQKARIKELPLEFPDPIVLLGKKHQVENGILAGDEFNEEEVFPNEKLDILLDLAVEYPRMVVFAKYKSQIDQIRRAFEGENYRTAVLTGDTQHRGDLIAYANRQEQCIFIAQSQISAGWQLPEYPCMVFASRTYSWTDYEQAKGRIQRADNVKKNLYINLVVKGGIDEAVDKSLANKQDFSERIYLKV